MTRTRTSAIYVAAFTAIMFMFYLLLALAYDRTPESSVLMSAVLAVISAALTSLSLAMRARMHRNAFTGKKQAAANTDTRQQRSVEIDLPYDTAFDLALEALTSLDGQAVPQPSSAFSTFQRLIGTKQRLRIYQTHRDTGSILAGLRTRTLGIPDVLDFSRITLRLEKIDNNTTRVHIDSQAKTLFELYDLGKNLHYVNHLALYLRRESQADTAASRLSDDSLAHDETAPAEARDRQQRKSGD